MALAMETSKVTTNGQVTIPADYRKLLGLKSGDKVLFHQRADGSVVIENATTFVLKSASVEAPQIAKDTSLNAVKSMQDKTFTLPTTAREYLQGSRDNASKNNNTIRPMESVVSELDDDFDSDDEPQYRGRHSR